MSMMLYGHPNSTYKGQNLVLVYCTSESDDLVYSLAQTEDLKESLLDLADGNALYALLFYNNLHTRRHKAYHDMLNINLAISNKGIIYKKVVNKLPMAFQPNDSQGLWVSRQEGSIPPYPIYIPFYLKKGTKSCIMHHSSSISHCVFFATKFTLRFQNVIVFVVVQ